jgi:hypothetical protein
MYACHIYSENPDKVVVPTSEEWRKTVESSLAKHAVMPFSNNTKNPAP